MNILVDLLPLTNDGQNGGSRVFILDLIHNLSKIENTFTYYLLINEESAILHERFINNNNIKFLKIEDLKERVFLNIFDFFFKKIFNSNIQSLKIDLYFYPFGYISQNNNSAPIVCIVYDCQHRAYPEFFTAEEINHREKYLKDIGLRANSIIAISNFSKESFHKFGFFKGKSITVININCKRVIGLNYQKPKIILPNKYLLYPANFWPHKNHEMLLHSFSIALRSGLSADLNLVLTGASTKRKFYLEYLAERLQLGDRVHFFEYLSDDDLTFVMKNSYAVFYPSLYEGFGMPVLEALNLGVPVACSNIAPLKEIAGNFAFFFSPNSLKSIVKSLILLDRDSFRERLKCRALQLAKISENPTASAIKYHKIFLNLCRN